MLGSNDFEESSQLQGRGQWSKADRIRCGDFTEGVALALDGATSAAPPWRATGRRWVECPARDCPRLFNFSSRLCFPPIFLRHLFVPSVVLVACSKGPPRQSRVPVRLADSLAFTTTYLGKDRACLIYLLCVLMLVFWGRQVFDFRMCSMTASVASLA